MKVLLIISAVTWELPQTLLALILIIFYKGIKEIHFYKSTWFVKTKKSYNHKGARAVSLGRIILIDDALYNNVRWKKHEYGHTIQSLFLGWFYLIVVGFFSYGHNFIWRKAWQGKKLYWDMFPENWADDLGQVTEHEKQKGF